MSNADKCREEFEKMEWVKERLKYVWWSQNNEYCDTGKHPKTNASFLNGALCLFREQQPKMEEMQKRIDNVLSLIESKSEEFYDSHCMDDILFLEKIETMLKGE